MDKIILDKQLDKVCRQIRRRVFETNSSSCHSLCIVGTDKYDLYNKQMKVEADDYNREYRFLKSPSDKAGYILTAIQYQNGGYEGTEYRCWLSDAIEEYTGIKPDLCIYADWDEEYDDEESRKYGSIDHESQDLLDDVFIQNEKFFKQEIKELIFNNKITIVIDSDG